MDLELPPDPKVDEVPRTPDLWAALALTAQMHDAATAAEIATFLGYALAALGPFTLASKRGENRPGSDETTNWNYAVCSPADSENEFVVRSRTKPTPDQFTLIELVTAHARTALVASQARTYLAKEHETDATVQELSRTVARLRRESDVRTILTRLSTTLAGEEAIVSALNEVTGLPVGVEDAFGNLRVATPPRTTTRYRRIGGHNHADAIGRAIASGHPVRDGERLFQVVRPDRKLLGAVFLADPTRRAGDFEQFALEHCATALALQMAHQRSIAEAEMRLRRDLGADLLDGLDNDTACARADALGYDLRKPQRVHALRWSATDAHALVSASHRHLDASRQPALVVRRGDIIAIVADAALSPATLYAGVRRILGKPGVVGVGTIADDPASLPHSFSDSVRALEIREHSMRPEGIVHFDDLGVYRILDAHANTGDVHEFVREWLGPLLDYDRRHRSTMTETLTQYLEYGGHYDETAAALRIHRSTLRYRMSRIHELTGRDLHDVDNRLNFHLATRALQVLSGSEPEHPMSGGPGPPEGSGNA
ncbi:MAG: PucR family transcriptional regulator [Rhodococcus sp.]|nr:PucR family transcriptional regulator [Rhodococcus sp. (in: high G+C Gram-positive bacteria)]